MSILTRPRRPIPDEFYAEIANAYRQATAAGHHDPLKRITEATGYPRGTVSRWIATARSKGILERTTPGRVTGLTPICRSCGRPL